MVIQRWQSLFLLLAAVCAGIACAMPMAETADGTAVTPVATPMILILTILGAAMALIGIFLFKNLKLQMSVALLAALFDVVAAGLGWHAAQTATPGAATWLLAVATVAALVARWRMAADLKLLRSADRLR